MINFVYVIHGIHAYESLLIPISDFLFFNFLKKSSKYRDGLPKATEQLQ